MDTDRYTLTVTLDAPFDDVEQRVRDALSDEGFGVLSEIDVRGALREKLGALGADARQRIERALAVLAGEGRRDR